MKTNTQQRRLKLTGPVGHDPFRPYFFVAKMCTIKSFRPTNIDVSPKIYQVLFILSVNKRN